MIKHYVGGSVCFRPVKFVCVWVHVGNSCWMEYRIREVR